jgi:glycosidase
LGPVGPETHAEAQAADETSVLAFYRRLLAFRRSSSALTRGDYRPGEVTARTLSYERCWRDERLRIVLNLSAEPETVAADGDVVLSTGRPIPRRKGRISVRGGEGVILRLAGP